MFCNAGVRPGGQGHFVSAKGHKAIDAPSGLIGLGKCMSWMRAGQLAALRQGPPIFLSVRLGGLMAGVT